MLPSPFRQLGFRPGLVLRHVTFPLFGSLAHPGGRDRHVAVTIQNIDPLIKALEANQVVGCSSLRSLVPCRPMSALAPPSWVPRNFLHAPFLDVPQRLSRPRCMMPPEFVRTLCGAGALHHVQIRPQVRWLAAGVCGAVFSLSEKHRVWDGSTARSARTLTDLVARVFLPLHSSRSLSLTSCERSQGGVHAGH